jgi:2-dehydropantoate 2-reductase
MKHLDFLAERFGDNAVLGGLAVISTTLDADGRILHLNDMHLMAFGERDGSISPRIKAVASAMSDAGFEARLSENIMQEMWEKWVFIAASAGINCLMRAAVGDIVAAGATGFTNALLEECRAIATTQGFPPADAAIRRMQGMLTAAGSTFTASMLRDIERGAPIEADHIIGDLLSRGEALDNKYPLLRVTDAQLKAYEARREREKAT